MVSNDELASSSADQEIAVDDSLFSHKSAIEEKIENILLWTHRKVGSEQLIAAKEQFYWKTGKFFSDDYFYVNRITYFIDYFIFERPLETSGPFAGNTPYKCYLQEEKNTSIETFIHSIFSVQKISESHIFLKDLSNPKVKHKVSRPDFESFDGILKHDIIQGFLYKIDGQLWLSRGLIFHPYKAYRTIKKNVRKHIKQENSQMILMLNQLARQQLRHKRHEHVNPKIFYLDSDC